MVDFNELVNKAKDFASKNPDKVREGITKAEGLISAQTGGKFDSQIHSAGDQVEKQLGVPDENAGQAQQPQAQPAQADQSQQTNATDGSAGAQ